MKQMPYIISLLTVMLILNSCTDECIVKKEPSLPGSREIMLNLQTAHLIEAGSTRSLTDHVDEGTGTSYTVRDIVLLEFDENGTRIGDPKYYTIDQLVDPIKIVMPQGDKTYTVAVLANYHDPGAIYAFSDATTLATLKEKYRKIQSMKDLYENGGSESTPSYDILMNGFQTITSTTDKLKITLYRNVAKLTLKLINKSTSELTIKSVQIKNVPTKMDYFYQLKQGDINDTCYPELNKFKRINYDREEVELTAGSTHELIYYLPCHLMGTDSTSTSEKTKGAYAPNYATYVELYGVSTADQTIVRYQFYLGDNMTNDYNLRPNYHYEVPLTFKGIGNPATDSRVTHMDAVITEPEANSYIINPLPTEEQPLYNIPVFNRINTFWNQEKAINHISNATAYTISQDNVWVAEILWQTSDKQLIEFYDATGAKTDYEGRAFPMYRGQVAMKIKPVRGAQGNVLIGVYRKDIATNNDPSTREYSWSWHLWITDYNPDECKSQNWDNRYKYALASGGEVHHYTGAMWNETGMYHNKWIMDRCLGAFSNEGKAVNGAMGLFYQFGRKDPLPCQGKVYGFNESYEIIPKTLTNYVRYSSANTIDYMVKHPTDYYQGITGNGGYNGGEEYIASNPYVANLWNDPDWNLKEGQTDKSFFDPCPPGWRIPEHLTWDGLKVYDYGEEGLKFYMDGIKGSDNSCWYPAYGAMSNSMTYIYFYTSTAYFSSTPVPNQNGQAYGLSNHNATAGISYTTGAYTGRQRGASIRPIEE